MKAYDTTLTEAELDIALCDLPDHYFTAGDKIGSLTAAAGYDESADRVVNNLHAWDWTARQFAESMKEEIAERAMPASE